MSYSVLNTFTAIASTILFLNVVYLSMIGRDRVSAQVLAKGYSLTTGIVQSCRNNICGFGENPRTGISVAPVTNISNSSNALLPCSANI